MTCSMWNDCIYSVLFIAVATWGLLNDEIVSRSVALWLCIAQGRPSDQHDNMAGRRRRAARDLCVCENGGGFSLSTSSLTPCQGWRSGPHSVLSAFVMLMEGVNASRSDSPSLQSFSPVSHPVCLPRCTCTPQKEISVYLELYKKKNLGAVMPPSWGKLFNY